MVRLKEKDVLFERSTDCIDAFYILEQCFSVAQLLAHLNWVKNVISETDVSDFAADEILSQVVDKGLLRPLAYSS